MAKRYIFDLESDGLLDTITKVWCLALYDVDSKEGFAFRPDEISEGIKLLNNADEVIGHNIINFDIPALEKIAGLKLRPTVKVTDTMVCVRTIWPDIEQRDITFREKLRRRGVIMPDKFFGSHSLGAWGYRLGERKLEFNDWTHFSEEMLTYCIQDTITNDVVYKKILSKGFSEKALDTEHKIHGYFRTMQEKGIHFNTPGAASLAAEIQTRRHEISEAVVSAFPAKVVQLKTKEKIIPFNPASRKQIGEALMLWGWKPKKYSKDAVILRENRNTHLKDIPVELRGQPVINEETLETGMNAVIKSHPEVGLLQEYLMLSKRIGQLLTGRNAWLKLEEGGVMHGAMNTMGCVTSRCSHMRPNLGQVPAAHSPYGPECRGLFYAPNGYNLVGSDLSGLELRMLAHYMFRYDDGEYANIVLNGSSKDGTDIHSVNQRAAGLPTRDAGKVFIYAWLYGAGAAKIGSIIGRGEKEGKELIAEFLDKTPALKKLRDAVTLAAARGYIVSLDGRHIPIRHKHAALNTLLQGGGAVIAKQWYNGIADRYINQQLDAYIALFVHDETQSIVKEEFTDLVVSIPQSVLTIVEKDLKIRVPLGCETKIGKTWYDTH